MVPGQDQVTIRKSIGIRGYSRDQVWSFLCCVSTFTQFVQKAQKEQGTPECTGSRQPLRVRRPYCSIALSWACLHFCQSKWHDSLIAGCKSSPWTDHVCYWLSATHVEGIYYERLLALLPAPHRFEFRTRSWGPQVQEILFWKSDGIW